MKIMLNILSKRKEIWLPIFLLSLFIIGVLAGTPIKQVFEYFPDEGYTLMGASLFLKGFSLYNQIWLDQPPLLTVILAYWFKLFGLSVYNGRILILIFSAILLWALYQTIKNQWGHLCAFVAVVFLILSNVFPLLSVSVMIGIPSLALAMLSIYCAILYRKSHLKYLLVLSGMFMALSLQIKLFTLFLLPFIALEIIQTRELNLKGKKEQSHSLAPLLLWSSSFLAVFLAITVIFFHFNLSILIKQLFEPHLRGAIMLGRKYTILAVWRILLTDYDIFLLALTGIILVLRQKKWESLFPVLWLISAFIILFLHRPVWEHYYPLISLPTCWLAAISFKEFFRLDIREGWFIKKNKYSPLDIFLRWLTAGIVIWTIFLLPVKCYRTHLLLKGKGEANLEEQAVVDLLRKYKAHTDWVVTDRPIFAFYANMLVPPEFAIICSKRFFTIEEGQDYFIDKLQKYKAKLILLNRPDYYGPKVISYIEENYDKVYQGEILPRIKLWIEWTIKPISLIKLIGSAWSMRGKPYTYADIWRPYRNIKLYIHKEISNSTGVRK